MAKIVRYQNYCKIISDDLGLMKELDRELSYKILGSEFSKAYKGYENASGDWIEWDGRKRLLNPNGRFPAGLYYRVLDFLSEKGIETIIEDNRPELTRGIPINISDRLKELNIVPRPYQIEAAETAECYDRGIVKAATSAGKTVMMALITANLGKSTIIMVIGTDLLYQTHDFFTSVFKEEIGIVGDGNCTVKNITIASVWTIGKVLGLTEKISLDDEVEKEKEISKDRYQEIKQMLNSSKVIILDECHIASASTIVGISKVIRAEHVLGFSGAPFRDDNSELMIEAFLGKNIVDLSAKDLIKQGYLVEPLIRFLAPEPYPYKSGKYQKIYSKYIIENEQRNGMVVKAALKMVEQGFIPLVLFNNIKHGDILYKMLKDKTNCVLLSGKDSSKVREKTKRDIEDGKVKCVIASRIFDIGLNLPILSGLVIASAGKSTVRALQRIGRVIRLYPGKKMAAVIDFADNAPYLSDHCQRRREIYESEFNVQWPKEKQEN
jgi:superfamily II DNA or RNA helicase